MMPLGSVIYIAGPISSDPLLGARQAVLAAGRLLRAGYVPLVPQLSVLWQMIEPVGYEEWLEYDFRLIDKCDALLRLPGESPGADREVAHAEKRGVPIYHWEIDILCNRSLHTTTR